MATAATYYASPNGTGTGTEEADPCSLSSGISKINSKGNASHTLVLKQGRYMLSSAIALTGANSGYQTTLRSETDNPADVILDAQGASEVMRLNKNVIVTGLTIMNGSNASLDVKHRAAGVRIGYYSDLDTLSIVSNCVVTCCTNEYTQDTRSSGNIVYGGAVCVYNSGLLIDSLVTNNTAVYRSAGVVLKSGTVRGCTVSGNTAPNGGGGIFVERESTGYIADSVISGNSGGTVSESSYGGGVACLFADSSLILTNCTITGNSAWRGGGVSNNWNLKFTASIIDCVITNNSSIAQGGGVCVRDQDQTDLSTRFVMRNCLVAFNRTSSSYEGGGIYLADYANPVIDSCTIVKNRSGSSGGAGIMHRWGGTVTNCIIASNIKATSSGSAEETGSKWCLPDPADSTARVSSAYVNCCVWPSVDDVFLAANGCVNADPQFTDASKGDFTLTGDSPCKNAGIFESWMAGAFDLAGKKRISDSIVDIGCYELYVPPGFMLIFR